jgi:hypothetical protein
MEDAVSRFAKDNKDPSLMTAVGLAAALWFPFFWPHIDSTVVWVYLGTLDSLPER